LWFGWFGFNAGSALAMNDVAITAFLTTHLAAAAGMLAWMLAEYLKQGKASAIGAASGLVAGLVGITPAAGYVAVGPAIIIGLVAGGGCFYAISLKHRLGYDDALDVVGVHGVGGLIGAILTGVFASPTVNPAVVLDGGRGKLILNQLLAVGAVGVFALVGTLILAKVVQATVGLRVSNRTEEVGLDNVIHGESGYGLDGALVGHAAISDPKAPTNGDLVTVN
jgi:ammonium transporter, Amt family